MNRKLWLDGLDGIIPGEVSIKDFSKIVNTDSVTTRRILEELSLNGIGKFDGTGIEFEESDKLRATMFALEKGILVDEAAKHLNWKDFEGLTASILELKGFATIRNLMLTNPRMEIDVIGIRLGVASRIAAATIGVLSFLDLARVKFVGKLFDRARNGIASVVYSLLAKLVASLHS